jgi:hypothetical protein
MAIKAEISFKVFNGIRVTHVRRTTIQNTVQDLRELVFDFVRKEYPELSLSDITKEDIRLAYGIIEIEAENGGRLFKLEINKVQ